MVYKMTIKKGEIYLANLGDVKCADIGKVRPVLIFQNNNLNRMISENLYSDVVIIPLSSQIKKSDFTYVLKKRDSLKKDSTVLCNAIKMIHSKRLLVEEGILTKLTDAEVHFIEEKISLLLDMRT